MKHSRFIFSFLFLFVFSVSAYSQQNANSLSGLVKQLSPSVVNISTTSVSKRKSFGFNSPFQDEQFEDLFERFFGDNIPDQEFRNRGLGSGFIVSSDGYVITNNHVIQKADEIEVVLEDGSKHKADVVGSDPKTDIALLKISPGKVLPAVRLGNSSILEIGDSVFAIGNPFGLGNTVTSGIVSAKGRSLGLGAYDDFIQTDAAINPGNSGGPLFNLNGEVVGVNTAIIAGGQGIGFAIPINIANEVFSQLKVSGKVVRGWLGVIVQEISPEISESLGLQSTDGALISDIAPDGPAEKAGLQRGDIILEVDGKKIIDMPQLPKTIATYKPDTFATLRVVRNGEQKIVRVKLGELPEDNKVAAVEQPEKKIEGKLGLVVSELTPQMMRRLRISSKEGVVVTNVIAGSAASESGFRVGDIILELEKENIDSISDYNKALSDAGDKKNLLFLVKRQNRTVYVALKV